MEVLTTKLHDPKDTAAQNNKQLQTLEDAEVSLMHAKGLLGTLQNDAAITKLIATLTSTIDNINELQADITCQLETPEPEIAEPDVTVENELATKPATLNASNQKLSAAMQYAPAVKPVKGNFNLHAIALQWKNDPGVPLSRVSNMGNATARVYNGLSNGNVKFNVIPRAVKVNFNRSAKDLNKAEEQARRIARAAVTNNFYNIYAIVNNKAKGFSNAGGATAHLRGALIRDACHEVGHLRPFRLGHSGVVEPNGQLKAYNDGTSFMGKFSSLKLTASQLYFLGWLPQNKVAQHDVNAPAFEYKLDNLDAKNAGDAVKAVYIPRSNQRPLFLSMPKVQDKYAFTLHLSTGGGSQRVKVFGQKAEYDNLVFETISKNASSGVVRISPKEASAKK